MKPIHLHPAAEAELDEAVAYHERQRIGLGTELHDEIQRVLHEIQENPELGAPYGRSQYRHFTVQRFPYVIYYAERDDLIRIAAISHGSRRPDYWKRRRFE